MAKVVDKNEVVFAVGDRVSLEGIVEAITMETGTVVVRMGNHPSNTGSGTSNPYPDQDQRVTTHFGSVRKL